MHLDSVHPVPHSLESIAVNLASTLHRWQHYEMAFVDYCQTRWSWECHTISHVYLFYYWFRRISINILPLLFVVDFNFRFHWDGAMNSLVAADYGSGSSDAYSSDEDDQNKSIRASATSAYNNSEKSTTSTTNDNNDYFLRDDDSDSSSDSDNENECKYVQLTFSHAGVRWFLLLLFLFFKFCVRQNETTKSIQILPSASAVLSSTSATGQVFNNPYKVAENAKIASLEKHVKMVGIGYWVLIVSPRNHFVNSLD